MSLTNGTQLAVDAKFPFDRFEEAMATEDAEARRRSTRPTPPTCAVT